MRKQWSMQKQWDQFRAWQIRYQFEVRWNRLAEDSQLPAPQCPAPTLGGDPYHSLYPHHREWGEHLSQSSQTRLRQRPTTTFETWHRWGLSNVQMHTQPFVSAIYILILQFFWVFFFMGISGLFPRYCWVKKSWKDFVLFFFFFFLLIFHSFSLFPSSIIFPFAAFFFLSVYISCS